MPDRASLEERLLADGLLVRDAEGRLRTTERWQAALARAAMALQRSGAPWRDLRLPIALALSHRYGEQSDEALADLVEVLLPVEEEFLPPLFGEDPGVVEG